MRLLMVARRFPPDVRSGTETVFAALYEEARRHHEVRLVVGYRGSPAGFPEGAVAVDLRGRLPYVQMARVAAREAREFRPDAILSNSVEAVLPGSALIVHDLNFGRAERDAGSVLREQLYRVQARRARVVIAVSEATRARLAGLGIEAVVIGNGVDLERFKPVERPRSDVTRFVYPGRILPGKGQHAALDALGRMRPDQRKGAHLVIVGAVADRHYADQLKVQSFKLPAEIHEDVPDIAPFYADADVVLFPTLMVEGFGFTAVEGMACGKPVIYYDQPAIREATGGIGIAVPRDDADALRNAMLRLMADPAERARLGAAGREYAQGLAWGRVWERYEAVLFR